MLSYPGYEQLRNLRAYNIDAKIANHFEDMAYNDMEQTRDRLVEFYSKLEERGLSLPNSNK